MSVSDGEKADAVNFNSSFVSREVDSNTAGKLDLDNAAPESGTALANIQKELNGQDSFVTDSPTVNTSKDRKPTWTSDAIGSASQAVKERVDSVQGQVESNITAIATNAADIVTNAQESADIRSTQGTSNGDTELGTFPGTVITDNTDVKTALTELETDVELKIYSSEKGAANGVAELDGTGKVPTAQLPTQLMEFEGNWNASTNTPTLANTDTDKQGTTYRVNVAGSTDFGAGSISFDVGDWVYNTGSLWEKGDNVDQVTLANAVTLTNKTMDADNNTFSNFEHGAEVDNPSSGVHGVTGSVVGTTDAQVITAKDIDGGTASNTNRITLPKDTTTNLDALTDKEATIAYDTTLGAPVFNDGAAWNELGGGGSGVIAKLISGGVWTNTEVDTEVNTAESLTDNNEVSNNSNTFLNGQSFLTTSAGDLSSCFFRLRQSGSGLSGNIRVKVYTALMTAASVPIATSDNIDITTLPTSNGDVVFTFSTPVALSASTTYYAAIDTTGITYSGGLLYYRLDTGNPYAGGSRLFTTGNLLSTWTTVVSQDLHFNFKVLGGSAPELSFTSDAFVQIPGITDGSNKIVSQNLTLLSNEVAYVTPSLVEAAPNTLTVTIDDIENVPQDTSYIIARHDNDGIIVGDSMRLEYGQSQEIYGDGVVPGAIITEWESYTPIYAGFVSGSYINDFGRFRRVGDSVEIMVTASKDATTGTGGSSVTVSLPTGLVIDTNKIPTTGGASAVFGGFLANATAEEGAVIYNNTTSVTFYDTAGFFVGSQWSANEELSARFTVPIAGWSAGALMSTTETLFSTAKVNVPGQIATGTLGAAFNDVVFGTTGEDTLGIYDNTTGEITIPKTGFYRLSATLEILSTLSTGSSTAVAIYNKTQAVRYATGNHRAEFTGGGTSTQQKYPSVSQSFKANKDDVIVVQSWVNGSTPSFTNSFTTCFFSFEEIPDFSIFSISNGQTELVDAYSGTNSTVASAGVWENKTSIDLTPGEWDISALLTSFNNGTVTSSNWGVAISTFSGATITDHVNGKNVAWDNISVASTQFQHNQTIPRYTLVISSTTTVYLKVYKANTITNFEVDNYYISARKIK